MADTSTVTIPSELGQDAAMDEALLFRRAHLRIGSDDLVGHARAVRSDGGVSVRVKFG